MLFKDMLKSLEGSQTMEEDNREMVNEADLFLNKRDGQWEPHIWNAWDGRPRYTLDQCNSVVDNILGEMDSMDFGVKVDPVSGDASKDIAIKYAGMIRHIENISNARYIYKHAARKMVGTGLSGWRIAQEYLDSDSFQQELLIKPLANFQERVWFDAGAEMWTMEDADDAWVLTALTSAKYEKLFPNGSKLSVGQQKYSSAYYNRKPDEVLVGEHYYRKTKKRELGRLSNGSTVVLDDEFAMIKDDLAERGITVESTRTRDVKVVYHRIFDGSDYLKDETEQVFEYIPVIPVYANFNIIDNKVIYWGAVEKLMDAQRILNYAESKKTAESALKPIEKIWMDKSQAESEDVTASLNTMNTNADPVQFYDHVDGIVQPYKLNPTQPDNILIETAAGAVNYIKSTSGIYSASKGEGLSGQSGETVRMLQNKGNSANYKYFTAMEIAIGHTGKILRKAMPKVYDTSQERRIIGEDGSIDSFILRQRVLDKDTNQMIEINNISIGQYDVTCSAGPAFQNKQQETLSAITNFAAIDPSVVQIGSDILLSNMPFPGIKDIAARKRRQMLLQGIIPKDQLTKEELAFIAENKDKEQEKDPIEVANLQIAQAELMKAQAQTQDVLSKMDERQTTAQLENKKMMLDFSAKQQQMEAAKDKNMADYIMAQTDQLKTQAETLRIITEALGIDAVVGRGGSNVITKQVALVTNAQRDQ